MIYLVNSVWGVDHISVYITPGITISELVNMSVSETYSPDYRICPTSQNVKGIQGSLQVQSACTKQQWSEYS